MSIGGFQDDSAQGTEGLAMNESKTGQDASAEVTEGLTLTEGEFLPKAMLFILYNSKVVSL